MSEFLMVVPAGWTEIVDPESIMTEESWNNANPWEVTEALKATGMIADGQAALDRRLFRDAGVLRLWVLIGTEQ